MNESIAVDRDSDVQLLACQVHEHEVAGLQVGSRDRRARLKLFLGGSRQLYSSAAGGVHHESAAIEPPGRSTAVSIRLSEHGRGARYDQGPRIHGLGRPRCGGSRSGVRAVQRCACTESESQSDDEDALVHAAVPSSVSGICHQRRGQGCADDAGFGAQRAHA
jgi:hypothetical protein